MLDRRVAFMPVTADNLDHGYLEVTDGPVVAALVELFERRWSQAVPGQEQGMARLSLSTREGDLVALLASGHTDASAAAALGVSRRTVTNLLRGLMDRLGVDNRFPARPRHRRAERHQVDRREHDACRRRHPVNLWIRPLVAAVAALILAAPAPASAVPVSWTTAACATGGMSVRPAPLGNVSLSGWIQPCPSSPLPPGAAFTVAYYGGWSATTGRLIGYSNADDLDGTADVAAFARILDALRPDYPPRAICLVFSPEQNGRLSCYALDPVEGSEQLGIRPVPVDDPLVAHRVAVVAPPGRDDDDPVPHCGNCV